jgi:hypothetical protein
MTITIEQIKNLKTKVTTALGILQEIDGFVTQTKVTPMWVPAPDLEGLFKELGSFFSLVESLGDKVKAPVVVPVEAPVQTNPPPANPVA